MTLKATLTVDFDLCQGHGQCQESAPEHFEVRDDGFAHVLADVTEPGDLIRVRDAANRCPVDAITITMVDQDAGA